MSNLTKAQMEQHIKQLEAQLAGVQKAQSTGLMVKVNASGGIYIRSSEFREWSAKKNKEYTAGINLGFNTAKVLFNSPELLEQIKEQVNQLSR
jgi:hypothetical protein